MRAWTQLRLTVALLHVGLNGVVAEKANDKTSISHEYNSQLTQLDLNE